MSVVLISMTCLPSSCEPENACDTHERSAKVAHDNVATRFSFLARDQSCTNQELCMEVR
jgi:hypothetical protein